MAEEKRSDQKKTGELTRSLPRNYRQIGEPGAKKILNQFIYCIVPSKLYIFSFHQLVMVDFRCT